MPREPFKWRPHKNLSTDARHWDGVARTSDEVAVMAMEQDHVHMVIDIPPKHSVAQIIGYVKGKSAIAVARQFGGRQRNFNGEKFWARGYAVSTVGLEKEDVRQYVQAQEQLDGHDGADEDGKF